MVSKGHDWGARSVSCGTGHERTPDSSYFARRSRYSSKHRTRCKSARDLSQKSDARAVRSLDTNEEDSARTNTKIDDCWKIFLVRGKKNINGRACGTTVL